MVSPAVQGDRVGATPGAPCVGTRLQGLQTGEEFVNEYSRAHANGGREHVRVRVVGDQSFGWAEAACTWGAGLELVVHRKFCNHMVNDLFKLPRSVDHTTALVLAPLPSLGTGFSWHLWITSMTQPSSLSCSLPGVHTLPSSRPPRLFLVLRDEASSLLPHLGTSD